MTAFTSADVVKIAGPRATFITTEQAREFCNLASGTRPRMYGLTDQFPGQIVSVQSHYHLDKYVLTHIWTTSTTLADLISPA